MDPKFEFHIDAIQWKMALNFKSVVGYEKLAADNCGINETSN